MRNRYLEDKAMRRRDMRGSRDYRYMPERDYRYGKDYARMDYRNDYTERDRGYDYRNDRDYRSSDYDSDYKYNREHTRNDMVEMYGLGKVSPHRYEREVGMDHRRDYRMDYGDMGYNNEEKEYKEDLHEWIEKLKHKDRIKVGKDQVLRQAKNMNVEFKDFDEEEFYAIYLMHISDYPEKSNDYNYYISMAKDWLKDDDVYYKGGEKVCSYLYGTVLGK